MTQKSFNFRGVVERKLLRARLSDGLRGHCVISIWRFEKEKWWENGNTGHLCKRRHTWIIFNICFKLRRRDYAGDCEEYFGNAEGHWALLTFIIHREKPWRNCVMKPSPGHILNHVFARKFGSTLWNLSLPCKTCKNNEKILLEWANLDLLPLKIFKRWDNVHFCAYRLKVKLLFVQEVKETAPGPSLQKAICHAAVTAYCLHNCMVV